MERSKQYLVLLSLAIVLLGRSDAETCTVCHSKNPKMVRMHEALGYKDCFLCHGPTAIKRVDPPGQQMTNDGRCVRCHVQDTTPSPLPKNAP